MELDCKDEQTTHLSQNDDLLNEMFTHLTDNDDICFKSQQRGESDLNKTEKLDIARTLYEKSKYNFLLKFGKFMPQHHIHHFKQFQNHCEESYEITMILKKLNRSTTKSLNTLDVRNRRYAALKRMVGNDSYFSETEMMKRNPLLYEQLVGQYMTEEEKKIRDKLETAKSFVGILLEGIERDDAEIKRKREEDAEFEEEEKSDEKSNCLSMDIDGFAQPSTSFWGEIEQPVKKKTTPNKINLEIGAQERTLLKQEFISSMYQNFLDGKDDDFDYEYIDNNDEYDNIDIMTQDAEEKYFDSEEPDECNMESEEVDNTKTVESSEDELDIYMNALNQHQTICQLSEDMEKL